MKTQVLPNFERYFYFGFSISGILYSLYQVYLVTNRLSVLVHKDLDDGWTFLSRKKDIADDEWNLWVNFILYTLSPWILVHYVGSKVIFFTRAKALPLWYSIITTVCLTVNHDLNSLVVLVLQPVIFSIVLIFTRSRLLLWLVCYILFYVFIQDQMISFLSISDEDARIIVPTVMWIYLRCISFSMDIANDELTFSKLYVFFGYVFYLPCFFLGPILLFEEFSKQLYQRTKSYAPRSELILILQNVRYLFWLFFAEFSLHFIYGHSLLSYMDLLPHFRYENVWVMYGIGFFMGQFFFLKYSVVYGLALTWTNAEGYDTPKPPRCVAYICLYSDMWRYFDQPLYFFIRRYIYDPGLNLVGRKSSLSKIVVSFLCFVFVYVWHGLHYAIFMWSLFNYCGIVVEMICRRISETYHYRQFVKRIGSGNERRMVAFLCAPLAIFSAISNFYFLGGPTVAETYISFIFIRGSIASIMYLWFFIYTLCQVSMEIKVSKF